MVLMSGITSNQSESFKSVLKRLQGWKEIRVDTAVLYHLQVYYWNEWQRGLAGQYYIYACMYITCCMSRFRRIHAYRSVYYLPSDEIDLIPTVALDDIVKSVKEGININTHAGLEDLHAQC